VTSYDALARELIDAERSRAPVNPLTKRQLDLSLADAYSIQQAGLRLRIAEGAVLVGHKVGLTSLAMQEMLGVDQPDFGYLTREMVSDSGAALAASAFIAPRIEAEIAFRLARPLQGSALAVSDVLDATGAVAPALEVIDSRVADWQIQIADTVADNASCGHVVLGEWRQLDGLALDEIELELSVEGPGDRREVVSGRGSAVLGHPATAVVWLADALHEYGGPELSAGHVVLPGAMARALPVEAGASVRASMGPLGEVSVSFAEAEADE
jgi:2-keto-4-pentenoate hydratase